MRFLKHIHPLSKLFISFSFILPIFFSNSLFPPLFYLLLSTVSMLLFDRVHPFRLLGILLFFLPFSSGIFLLNVFHGRVETQGQLASLFGFVVNRENLNRGIVLGLRIYSLGVISVSWVLLIDFSRMIQGLMQSFRLDPKIGYSLFVGINAIPTIRDEYVRVKQVKKLRGIRGLRLVPILVNILTQAIRYSERASLAMTSRGLHTKRSFYHDHRILPKDLYTAAAWYAVIGITLVVLIRSRLYVFGI